jgi:hypothetical protein
MAKRLERSYICSGCKGVVSLPTGTRRFTLEQVREHHNQTCPSRRAAT